ncbi:MAG: hypothetical protein HY880_05255 [Deltaproteobacteria bacterium]|nr:hypothetical protein [Deltaproteobacteria bacterium]
MLSKVSGLSITRKFAIFLAFFFLFVLVNSLLFIFKSKEIVFYDDLERRLNAIKFSILRLEYVLDMYVVGWQFEKQRIELLTEDLARVDRHVSELAGLEYEVFFEDKSPLIDGMKSLSEDWKTIQNELSRLNKALSKDEVFLIHNAVDMNTFLFAERSDNLLKDISEGRKGVYDDIKGMAVESLVIFMLLILIAGAIFHRRVLSPIKRLARLAAASNSDTRIMLNESSGEAGEISRAFNRHLETSVRLRSAMQKEIVALTAESGLRRSQIDALMRIASTAGGSLVEADLLRSVADSALDAAGAGVLALYMKHGENLRLVSSSGMDAQAAAEVSSMSADFLLHEVKEKARIIEAGSEESVRSGFKKFFDIMGSSFLICVPIPSMDGPRGYIVVSYASYDSMSLATGGYIPFVEAAASLVGVLMAYALLFRAEYDRKDFLERLFEHAPEGIAVFSMDGKALMLNNALKDCLGVGSEDDFIARYNIFEDDIFEEGGFMPLIRSSYEGRTNEMVVDYDPAQLTWCDFKGAAKRLRITSFPVYNASGGIIGIGLTYEETSVSAQRTTV